MRLFFNPEKSAVLCWHESLGKINWHLVNLPPQTPEQNFDNTMTGNIMKTFQPPVAKDTSFLPRKPKCRRKRSFITHSVSHWENYVLHCLVNNFPSGLKCNFLMFCSSLSHFKISNPSEYVFNLGSAGPKTLGFYQKQFALIEEPILDVIFQPITFWRGNSGERVDVVWLVLSD